MPPPNRDVFDSKGQKVALGAELGSGGEGAVFEVRGNANLAAKVYHDPLTPDRAEKIRTMARLGNERISKLVAWPNDLLSDRSGKPTGLLLPKFSGRHDIHKLYSPKSRRSDFQRADWRFLMRTAANAARVFAAVHEMGCVIGDVNHGSILVGQDATVRLIDCDSFQLIHAGRRFVCDVGVDTFTPPELQRKSFAAIVRTENHDNFGLAVLAFLLLFMGRHPFAGKFLGKGDMPIPQAIEEFRFAYGSGRARVNMEQPPNTPPLSIVGNDVALLFERAFSNQVTNGGRPGPREWTTALSALESSLKQCSGSAAHWYLRTLSACPWCKMEAATGVSLFGLVIQGAAATHFNLDALWREVERIPDPGPAPTFGALTVPASAEAQKVGSNETTRNVVGGMVALAIAGFAVSGYAKAFTMILLMLAVAAFFVVRKMLDNSEGMQKFTAAHTAAESKWRSAERDWESRAGPSEFLAKKSDLEKLRRKWQNLPAERLRRLEQLNQQRQQKQLEHFLDRFEIDRAKIEGIGPARKQTLESYGIETAADLTRSAIDRVPGFGPKLRSQLMAWRSSVESRFRFDPSKGVDPQDIAKVEHDMLTLKKNTEDQLRTGLAELKALANRINAVRTGMRSQVEALQREYAQAAADYAAVRRTR